MLQENLRLKAFAEIYTMHSCRLHCCRGSAVRAALRRPAFPVRARNPCCEMKPRKPEGSDLVLAPGPPHGELQDQLRRRVPALDLI